MTRNLPRCRAIVAVLAALATCAALGACKSGGAQPSPPPGVTLASLAVTSRSFASGGQIPVDFSCDGADRSPQLTWSAPPAGTKSLAVVVDDPDAPGGDFTHWLVYNIRPETLALAEAVDPAELGASVGINGFNRQAYSGPCPPRMELHHYFFRVFALDAPLDAKPGANREAVDAAMSGHVLAEGALVGVFSH
jgi:Raf kinase inhibitor-like YbhB/YbcL family protein